MSAVSEDLRCAVCRFRLETGVSQCPRCHVDLSEWVGLFAATTALDTVLGAAEGELAVVLAGLRRLAWPLLEG
jgi:hypothetical protein